MSLVRNVMADFQVESFGRVKAFRQMECIMHWWKRRVRVASFARPTQFMYLCSPPPSPYGWISCVFMCVSIRENRYYSIPAIRNTISFDRSAKHTRKTLWCGRPFAKVCGKMWNGLAKLCALPSLLLLNARLGDWTVWMCVFVCLCGFVWRAFMYSIVGGWRRSN